MQEVFGNAIQLAKNYNILCVTTNGTLRKDGACVMGRGIAKTIKELYPNVPYVLGKLIKQNGNITQHIITTKHNVDLVAFPVKHNWYETADIELIKRSCIQLIKYADGKTVLLPRPGCGNGKLDWQQVKPIIEKILPDNIYIVHWNTSIK